MTVSSQIGELPDRVQRALAGSDADPARWDAVLETIAEAFGAINVTLHFLDLDGELLHLVRCRGMPEKLLEITRRIPVGKGMAGLCAQRREPVTVCNLQTDDSGKARPGAKATRVEGAIVIPVFDDDRNLLGTLGVGKAEEHEYSVGEVEVLENCAAVLAGPVSELRKAAGSAAAGQEGS